MCARGVAAIAAAGGDVDAAVAASAMSAAETLLVVGRTEEGLTAVFTALANARGKGDAAGADAAKELALATFDALGQGNPLVVDGRKRLSNALFR